MATTRINGVRVNIGALTDTELASVIEHAKARLLAAQKEVHVLCNEQDYRVRFGTVPQSVQLDLFEVMT